MAAAVVAAAADNHPCSRGPRSSHSGRPGRCRPRRRGRCYRGSTVGSGWSRCSSHPRHNGRTPRRSHAGRCKRRPGGEEASGRGAVAGAREAPMAGREAATAGTEPGSSRLLFASASGAARVALAGSTRPGTRRLSASRIDQRCRGRGQSTGRRPPRTHSSDLPRGSTFRACSRRMRQIAPGRTRRSRALPGGVGTETGAARAVGLGAGAGEAWAVVEEEAWAAAAAAAAVAAAMVVGSRPDSWHHELSDNVPHYTSRLPCTALGL